MYLDSNIEKMIQIQHIKNYSESNIKKIIQIQTFNKFYRIKQLLRFNLTILIWKLSQNDISYNGTGKIKAYQRLVNPTLLVNSTVIESSYGPQNFALNYLT